jgi:hypothetical protein
MESAVSKALKMMAIALPTMFFVIAIFYVATKALHKAFPAPVEEEEEEEEE